MSEAGLPSVLDEHDAVLLDLDGTVHRGAELIPCAADAVEAARAYGVAVRYVTNNASKPAATIADELTGRGLTAHADEVSTSAQAGAAMLVRAVDPGARVLVVGTEALEAEVTEVGLVPVRRAADDPVAVVQGHSPHTGWENLAEACLALRRGVLWVACNRDATLPAERGELPGNGAMVAALRCATGRSPSVAGKPERPLLDRAVASARAHRPLVVGDRLETDIAGAARAGIPSATVLSGVSTPRDILYAPPEQRSDLVATDLAFLRRPRHESLVADSPEWKITSGEDGLQLATASDEPGNDLSALRALCAAWWRVGSGSVAVHAHDEYARAVLDRLRLV